MAPSGSTHRRLRLAHSTRTGSAGCRLHLRSGCCLMGSRLAVLSCCRRFDRRQASFVVLLLIVGMLVAACDGSEPSPTTDAASVSLAIDGGQPLGTTPPSQGCQAEISYRFTPGSLTGSDGVSNEFESTVTKSVPASLRDSVYYCDYYHFVGDVRAGSWQISITMGAWSTSCERTFSRNAFANLVKFHEFQQGCAP
jgi:hypothetical protein